MSADHDKPTRASLLDRLKNPGDSQPGWNEFVACYESLLRAWCKRRGLREVDTDDVVQTVWTKLTVVMKTFEYDPARGFRKWLKTVVENAVNDWFRKQARQPGAVGAGGSNAIESLPDPAAELGGEMSSVRSDRLARLLVVLDELDGPTNRNQWQAFVQTEMDQKPVAEVAAALGMTFAAVCQARYRIKKKITARMLALEQEQGQVDREEQ